MNYGMAIASAIIGALLGVLVYAIVWLVKGEPPFKKGKRKIYIILLVLIFAIPIGGLGGVFFGGRVIKGDYADHKCAVKGCSEKASYYVGSFFNPIGSNPYYCSNHLMEAKETMKKNEVVVYESSGHKSDEDAFGHTKYNAAAVAEATVKAQLKSPKSAKFCSANEMTITYNESTWTISGWVDAQNSFGATVRSNFTVKITYTSDNNYTVDSCSIR